MPFLEVPSVMDGYDIGVCQFAGSLRLRKKLLLGLESLIAALVVAMRGFMVLMATFLLIRGSRPRNTLPIAPLLVLSLLQLLLR